MNLIIITGPPASGKSSLAADCSRVLKIPWYSKDRFKVELYEKFGFTSHAEKKKLSLKGEAQLLEMIHEHYIRNEDLIVDNNFKNFDALRTQIINGANPCNIICICLQANPALLAKRYNERISSGNREVSLYSLNQYPVIQGITEFHKPIDAEQVKNIQSSVVEETYGDHITYIDTNGLEQDYNQIFNKVLEYIRENLR